jgi:hypothetical protein
MSLEGEGRIQDGDQLGTLQGKNQRISRLERRIRGWPFCTFLYASSLARDLWKSVSNDITANVEK